MSNDWQNNQADFGQTPNPYQASAGGGMAYEQPQRSWFGRNWWWFVPGVILLPILACGGCFLGFRAFKIAHTKASPPYQQALAAVQDSPEVQEALGQPIEDTTWVPTGELTVDNNRGEANLIFQVAGPKGSATVSFNARMVGGTWGLNELVVTVDQTGERIVIDTTELGDRDAGGGAAPAWGGDAPAWPADPDSEPPAADNPEATPAGDPQT